MVEIDDEIIKILVDSELERTNKLYVEFTRRMIASQIADDYKLTPQELWDLYEK